MDHAMSTFNDSKSFMDGSLMKLTQIDNTYEKAAKDWLKLMGLLEKVRGRLPEKVVEPQIHTIAATKIQAWWRGVHYRRAAMLPEHKQRLSVCVRKLREAPCSEANPKQERGEPLNQRIQRYMDGLVSTVLTERKVMALRLNYLANCSHVATECMLDKGIFSSILDCLTDLNRSEAHLYVIRPLCALTIKLLSYKPFVEQFVPPNLSRLVSTAVHLIHNNYKDPDVVADQALTLKLLSTYPGFIPALTAIHFNWYMQKFKELFGRLVKSADKSKAQHTRLLAYRQLCELQKFMADNCQH